MKFLLFRKTRPKLDYLLLQPLQVAEQEIDANGIVTILFPKFLNSFAKKYFNPLLKSPCVRVKLDALGSATWLMMDGKKNVREIAVELAKKFDDSQDSFEERVSKFVSLLYAQKMITFICKSPDQNLTD